MGLKQRINNGETSNHNVCGVWLFCILILEDKNFDTAPSRTSIHIHVCKKNYYYLWLFVYELIVCQPPATEGLF